MHTAPFDLTPPGSSQRGLRRFTAVYGSLRRSLYPKPPLHKMSVFKELQPLRSQKGGLGGLRYVLRSSRLALIHPRSAQRWPRFVLSASGGGVKGPLPISRLSHSIRVKGLSAPFRKFKQAMAFHLFALYNTVEAEAYYPSFQQIVCGPNRFGFFFPLWQRGALKIVDFHRRQA